ncbi:hypothetical protein FUAX_31060 [Fulvitalea axinellae]|uniref:Uncharacterized protein n=1 Tax=Fulvitalea axinellae TaxID=1182444 RepID=A0AAU9CW04_9BACT|nr:hypothetical protein FUAX_31060 [Fulvitalea axinellae]
MSIRPTKGNLTKLEDIFAESDFILRYEKGNFKSGYCVLKSQRVVVVNKYYSLDGKVNCLVDILKDLDFDTDKLNKDSLALLSKIRG